jgi:hypothetical protein
LYLLPHIPVSSGYNKWVIVITVLHLFVICNHQWQNQRSTVKAIRYLVDKVYCQRSLWLLLVIFLVYTIVIARIKESLWLPFVILSIITLTTVRQWQNQRIIVTVVWHLAYIIIIIVMIILYFWKQIQLIGLYNINILHGINDL